MQKRAGNGTPFQAVFMDADKMNIRAIQRNGIAKIMDGKRNW